MRQVISQHQWIKICNFIKLWKTALRRIFLAVLMMSLMYPSGQVDAANDLATFANLSVEANPHTGSANFSIPLQVPQGRAGIQPNISLSYNSSSPNGPYGVGWSLELGSIVRSAKHGVPSYTDDDTFILIQNGSAQELVYDSSADVYRPEIEGSFMKIKQTGDYWTVTDKNGVVYTFGQTSQAREFDPDDVSRVFKWGIERVEDLHGNYMTFEYYSHGKYINPKAIYYTGNDQQSKDPYAHISFWYTDRIEKANDRYVAGFKQSTSYVLDNISMSINPGDHFQRKYLFEYESSPSTGRSLLSKVEVMSAGGQTLPAMTFDYQESDPSFTLVTYQSNVASGDNLWNIRQGGGYDRGHDNFVTCGFDVNMGPTYTQASGRGACGPFSVNTSTAQVDIRGGQDCANEAWTYVYSTT